jgi:hypothetical protein
VRELTLIAPGALGPWPHEFASYVCDSLELPHLQLWLNRSDRGASAPLLKEASIAHGAERTLAAQLGYAGDLDALPMAAFTALGDGLNVREGDAVTSIDPVHLVAHPHGAQVTSGAALGLSDADAQEFADAVRPILSAQEQLEVGAPTRWYLRASEAPDIVTHSPFAVFGPAIEPALPHGTDGRRWRAVLTEIQMTLHAHALNEGREMAGQMPINSVWIWGQGRLPPASQPRPDVHVFADGQACRGLTQWAGATLSQRPSSTAELFADCDANHALVVVPEFAGLATRGQVEDWRERLQSFEQNWLAPLTTALRAGLVSSISLEIAPLPTLTLSRRALRRFWRFARPLSSHISAT